MLVLPPDARARVLEHPERSERSIRQIAHLSSLAPLVRHHHEWWDGTGYPDRLKGDQIPMGAQILRLADTVVALGTARPQRGPLAQSEVIAVVEVKSRVVCKSTGVLSIQERIVCSRAIRISDRLVDDRPRGRSTLTASGILVPRAVIWLARKTAATSRATRLRRRCGTLASTLLPTPEPGRAHPRASR